MKMNNQSVRGFEVISKYKDKKINLPKRHSRGSAGYDFEAACDLVIKSHDLNPILVPTGIKAYMPEDECLLLINRSGNPLKKGLVMPNGIGVVDSDYYNNPGNEGEIFFQLINLKDQEVEIKKGERIGQGIFTKFLKTAQDRAQETRIGGFGSSGD